ncbi:GlcG/HbpS family heme-binding protein [Streptomyces spiralis]
MTLSAALVQKLITAAQAEAVRQGFPPVNISVCDSAGHLAGFLRMDRAVLGTVDVAHRKARTAALFETDSATLGGVAHPDGPSYMVEHTNGGLINFGGGVVLKGDGGNVIGAVGVSGASVEEDEVIAQAAVAAARTQEFLGDAA